MTELIPFRAFQGLGAGAMLPITQAIIGDIFPPAQRAKWAGVLMSVFAVATIIGPLLGGWITDNFGWRWVFYVNLPVGVIALAFAASSPARPRRRPLAPHRLQRRGAARRRRRPAAARLQLGRQRVRLGLAGRSSACSSSRPS